jgi:hypothetical protein
MKILSSLILAGGLAGFATVGYASKGFEGNSPEQTPSEQASTPDEVAQSEGEAKRRLCPDQTATRIKHRKGAECMSPGRVYTREDLDSTGAVDTAEALGRLDPSLRTNGN